MSAPSASSLSVEVLSPVVDINYGCLKGKRRNSGVRIRTPFSSIISHFLFLDQSGMVNPVRGRGPRHRSSYVMPRHHIMFQAFR